MYINHLKRTSKGANVACNIIDSWDHLYEVKARIEKAKSAFIPTQEYTMQHKAKHITSSSNDPALQLMTASV